MVADAHPRSRSRACALGLGLLLAACVQARDKNEVGTGKVTSGVSFANPDYVAAPGSSGPATGLVPPAGNPGASGNAAPVQTAPMAGGSTGTGNAGSPSTASAGSTAAAGTGGSIGSVGGSTAPAGGAGGTPPTSVSGGTLTIQFTSVDQGGRYAPDNVGAIWIETAAGMFVKTIERWAGIRARHLTAWAAASGGWGSGFGFFGGGSTGNTEDQTDAISSASLRRHQAHMNTWDLKGLDGQLVADGKYKVRIEITEDNRVAGANAGAEFEKGPMPQTVMAPDMPPYSGLKLTYQP